MDAPVFRPTSPGISELIRELLSKVGELVGTQVELAKTEVKVESRKLALAIGFGVATLMIVSVFLIFLGVSSILLFAQVVDLVWASVITTVIFLVLAGVAAGLMVREIRRNTDTVNVG